MIGRWVFERRGWPVGRWVFERRGWVVGRLLVQEDIDGPSSVISPNLRLEEEVCLEKCEGEYMFTASTCISHEHHQHHPLPPAPHPCGVPGLAIIIQY